ncbi:hypothetical protein B0O40_1825 [Ruminococcaceae bacterium R-25]|nr:hypothetical protein B0O40_1825 [Ruminococcaceae bacterium R-25]SUQ21689.1 hypothetical protein SAMN06297423_1825 [Oscillospiraceae bacterium]
MKSKAGDIIKTIISVILNCFIVLVGFWFILTAIYIPANTNEYYFLKTPSIWEGRELTLIQDVTVDNSGHSDNPVTLKKGTVITSEEIRQNGVRYVDDIDGEHYHQDIPLECFEECEALKEELKEIAASNKKRRIEIMMPANITILIVGGLYLTAAVYLTFKFIKKDKRKIAVLSTILLTVVLVLILAALSIYTVCFHAVIHK